MKRLFSEPQTLDNGSVAFDVLFLDVVQETATLTDKLQEAPARMMILFMHLEMLRQIFDPPAQKRNLNFR